MKAKSWLGIGWGALGSIIITVGAVALAGITLFLTALFAMVLPGLAFPTFGVGAISTLTLSTGFGIFVAFIAQIVVSVWGGKWLMTRFSPATNQRFASLALGLILYVLVSSILVFGSMVDLGVSLLGMGCLFV